MTMQKSKNDTDDASSSAQPAPRSNNLNEQMDQVVSLLAARSRGEVGNQDVENAVSGILSGQNVPPRIQQDTDNYDDLDEDEPPPAHQSTATRESNKRVKTLAKPTVESMRKANNQNDVQHNPLDDIPLGREGARMMITFGDGPSPDAETVSAALLGARRCLQVAIKDARALRRHAKDEYLRARRVAQLGKNKKAKLGPQDYQQDHVDPNMLYRAIEGYDRLAYDPKCGFDIDQLRQLFPEEMNAYTRWDKMHKAYEESAEDDAAKAENAGDDEDAESETNKDTKDAAEPSIGHLEERAAQFDARTDQMDNDWYLKFSEVRQGSFLARRAKGKRTEGEKQWDASRAKAAARGRRKEQGRWEHMTAATVKFLHWVGFDPSSALPPPNDDTAQALAFLAYDFLGRIVEKAIYLRNKASQSAENGDDGDFLLELGEDEQLSAQDIEKAMNDSDIKPVSLYSSPGDDGPPKQFAAQLYFGPGFEERLEMEMDELASGTNKRKALSQEEIDTRKKEDTLFAEIEKPPAPFEGTAQLSMDENENEQESDHPAD